MGCASLSLYSMAHGLLQCPAPLQILYISLLYLFVLLLFEVSSKSQVNLFPKFSPIIFFLSLIYRAEKTKAFISSFDRTIVILYGVPKSTLQEFLISFSKWSKRKILVLPSFYSSRNLTPEQWQPQIAQPASSHIPNRREDLNPHSQAQGWFSNNTIPVAEVSDCKELLSPNRYR